VGWFDTPNTHKRRKNGKGRKKKKNTRVTQILFCLTGAGEESAREAREYGKTRKESVEFDRHPERVKRE